MKIFGSQSADHWLKCVGSHKITCISGELLHFCLVNWYMYLLACFSLTHANLSGPGLHKTASSVALYRITSVWLYCVVFDDDIYFLKR